MVVHFHVCCREGIQVGSVTRHEGIGYVIVDEAGASAPWQQMCVLPPRVAVVGAGLPWPVTFYLTKMQTQ